MCQFCTCWTNRIGEISLNLKTELFAYYKVLFSALIILICFQVSEAFAVNAH